MAIQHVLVNLKTLLATSKIISLALHPNLQCNHWSTTVLIDSPPQLLLGVSSKYGPQHIQILSHLNNHMPDSPTMLINPSFLRPQSRPETLKSPPLNIRILNPLAATL